jgi:lysophospholipase L1-like esterase
MKKRTLIILLVVLVCAGIYLNRSYAYIYDKIDDMALTASNSKQTYSFGDTQTSNKDIIYVALGDSLTAGVGVDTYEQSYPYQFAQKLAQKNMQVTLYPYAIPGAKTKDITRSLLDAAIKPSPDIMTILIGVNDIHGGISTTEFKNNYEYILKRLTQETHAKIYIVNIPYIGSPKLILPPHSIYFDKKTQDYNEILTQLATQYDVEYVDLYTPTHESAKQELYYASDLFHPSYLGYTLWAQILYDSFNK